MGAVKTNRKKAYLLGFPKLCRATLSYSQTIHKTEVRELQRERQKNQKRILIETNNRRKMAGLPLIRRAKS